jgi:hypothetical protein
MTARLFILTKMDIIQLRDDCQKVLDEGNS